LVEAAAHDTLVPDALNLSADEYLHF